MLYKLFVVLVFALGGHLSIHFGFHTSGRQHATPVHRSCMNSLWQHCTKFLQHIKHLGPLLFAFFFAMTDGEVSDGLVSSDDGEIVDEEPDAALQADLLRLMKADVESEIAKACLCNHSPDTRQGQEVF